MFDSSVWISALQFGGVPIDALDFAVEHFRVSICEQILDEIYPALTRKFNWRETAIDEALAEYAIGTMIVPVPGELRGICRDPKDDMVLECAVVAGAEIIVTGDKDLLAVRNYQGIRVTTPREFLGEYATLDEA